MSVPVNPVRPIAQNHGNVLSFQKAVTDWLAVYTPKIQGMKEIIPPPPPPFTQTIDPYTNSAKVLVQAYEIWYKEMNQWILWYSGMHKKAIEAAAIAAKKAAEAKAAEAAAKAKAEEAARKEAEARKAQEEAARKEAEANKAADETCPPGYTFKDGRCVDKSYVASKPETTTTTTTTPTTPTTTPSTTTTSPSTTITTPSSTYIPQTFAYTDAGSSKMLIAIPIILGVLLIGGIGTFVAVKKIKKKKAPVIE